MNLYQAHLMFKVPPIRVCVTQGKENPQSQG